ncbi:MAG: SDR family oxidoreductase [Candidatus Omnitrophica bacterium]|nr:SDR family oxidoreductase [Candidatus Omnitrophota bacterium]
MSKKKVMIFGCGGMLGKAVYEKFKERYDVLATDIDVNETWLEYLDVRDLNAILKRVADFGPGLLINLAALTDLEYCEKHPQEAWLTNALGQENIALAGQKFDIACVYVSAASVFDGKQEFYNDADNPKPVNVYGKGKYYGEVVTQQMLKKYFIFRAGWMMGGGIKKDKKFINKIFKQVSAGAKELFVVEDKHGTPTYTVDFASSMYNIVQGDFYGLYNMVCTGSASRYEVAKEFIKCLGLEKEVKINPVNSAYFEKEYFAPRPKSEKLINLKLQKRGMLYMREWKECLAEYAQVLKKEKLKHASHKDAEPQRKE